MPNRWLIAALVICSLMCAARSRAQAPESQVINRADVQFFSGSQSNFLTSEPVITIFQRVRDPTSLFLQKTSSRQTAEIGDFLDYTLQLRNIATNGFNVVVIDDVLPFGFAYEKGSTRFQGTRVADPVGGAGPKLRFTGGPIGANETVTLTYRVRIGPGARAWGGGQDRGRVEPRIGPGPHPCAVGAGRRGGGASRGPRILRGAPRARGRAPGGGAPRRVRADPGLTGRRPSPGFAAVARHFAGV